MKTFRTMTAATRYLSLLMQHDPQTSRKIKVVDDPKRGWLYAVVEA